MLIVENLTEFNHMLEVNFLLVVNFFLCATLVRINLLLLGLIKETLPCFAACMSSNSEEAESCSSRIRPLLSPRGNGQAKR